MRDIGVEIKEVEIKRPVSPKRPLRWQQRRARMALAPRTVQNIPDCLMRWPITVLPPSPSASISRLVCRAREFLFYIFLFCVPGKRLDMICFIPTAKWAFDTCGRGFALYCSSS